MASSAPAYEVDSRGMQRLALQPEGYNTWKWRGHNVNWVAAGERCMMHRHASSLRNSSGGPADPGAAAVNPARPAARRRQRGPAGAADPRIWGVLLSLALPAARAQQGLPRLCDRLPWVRVVGQAAGRLQLVQRVEGADHRRESRGDRRDPDRGQLVSGTWRRLSAGGAASPCPARPLVPRRFHPRGGPGG